MSNFTFFESYSEALNEIEDEAAKGELAVAIINYGCNGLEPELSTGWLRAVFCAMKPNLDKSREKAKASSKTESKSVSRNEKTKSESVFSDGKTESESVSHDSENKNEICPPKEKEKDKEKEIKEELPNGSSKKAPSRFRPPSLAEIRDYVKSHNLDAVDPEGFHAYYESNGWKVGKNPMKSWTAALQSWQRRDQGKSQSERKEMLDELTAEFESAF